MSRLSGTFRMSDGLEVVLATCEIHGPIHFYRMESEAASGWICTGGLQRGQVIDEAAGCWSMMLDEHVTPDGGEVSDLRRLWGGMPKGSEMYEKLHQDTYRFWYGKDQA